MGDRVPDQFGNVLIGQTIKDVPAVPPAANQSFIPQHLQALGDGRNLFALGFRNFRNAALALSQPRQEPKPGPVPQSPKDPRGLFKRSLIYSQFPAGGGMVVDQALGIRGESHWINSSFEQLFK